MSPEERKQAIKITLDQVRGRVKTIVYTGSNDTKTAIELSQFAEKCGADAISSVRPFYGGFSAADIKRYYKDLSECVKIPVLAYNNAAVQLSGINEIKDICSLPNCLGVKYTLPNHFEMELVKQAIGDKKVYSGADEMFFSACLTEVDGAIGTSYNIALDLYKHFRKVFESGDMKEIKRMNALNTELVSLLISFNYMSVLKSILAEYTGGTPTAREPFANATPEKFQELKNALHKLGEKYDMKGFKIFEM